MTNLINGSSSAGMGGTGPNGHDYQAPTVLPPTQVGVTPERSVGKQEHAELIAHIDPTVPRPLSDRIIASITLMNLSAPVAIVVIALLTFLSWVAAYFLGGGTNVAPHWFYVPVFLAGLRFGPFGALVIAAISTFVAGPLLPADVATRTPQALSDWVSRGIFFIVIGQFVTLLFGGVRRMSRREIHLQTKVELSVTELQDREARFSALVENSSDLVTIVDRDGLILFHSPSVVRALGWDEDSTDGTSFVAALHDSDQQRWRAIVDLMVEDSDGEMVAEWQVRHADGSWRFLQSVITNLIHVPSVGGLVLNSRDITDQKALEDQLRHQAFHDQLTGLANRALFAEHLDQALRRQSRMGGELAILFIDLDEFKTVNDLHGHALGDELLKQAAERLTTTLRDADAIARMGGDEFAALFEGVAFGHDARAAAERVIESFARPFLFESTEVFVTASMGMALNDSGTESAEDLIRNADLAMYAAKTANKGRYEVFSTNMHSTILDRMQMELDLRHALDRGEFAAYYQPIVALPSRTIVGAEALIRWNHPQHGLVMPGEFIGIAESSGIIVQIGAWMLHQACKEFEVLTRGVAGGKNLGLSVNLSTRQLSDPLLIDTVRQALANSGLEARRLTLEITESAIMVDVPNALRVLAELRSFGVKIAIDDFGTGYSSLSLLSEIPVDTIKVDRSFVTDVATRSEPGRLIRAIQALASDFGLRTVAEGVEELDQLEAIEGLECQGAQGFYFARPQPAPQLAELLERVTSFSVVVT
jgi:diguanylate cyclase (GGDEF)-like protein/PAS domain S-box-containing protein